MKRVKALSIILIFILVSQVVFSHLVVVSGADSGQSNTLSENANKIEVKNTATDEESITWSVMINGSLDESVQAIIKIGSGLTHGTVKDVSGVDVQETKQGYDVKLPEKDEKYTIELTTKIESQQESYTIEVETPSSDGNSSSDTVTIPVTEEDEKEDASENEKDATSEVEEVEKVEKEAEEKEEAKSGEAGGVEESNNLEDTSSPSHSVFSKSNNPIALLGEAPGEEWPNPGSLKLEKTAEKTGSFAEWEVELNVEGKNLKTSSDIVIVFDRSNSMIEGNREAKAKAAAKEFVNNLLVDENSTVRIALIPFGSETGTVNDPHTDFQDYSGRNTLLTAIDAIQIYSTHQSGGTNIHAGLHAAKQKLSDSTADQRIIVLMSDGEPTYSMKANGYDKPYSWPSNRYDFILKDFDYGTRVGSGTAGNSPNYGFDRYRCGFLNLSWCYEVEVKDHVIPTISEAKYIMDSGIGIYSVGLEVGNAPGAIYTLQNSQNKGYYQGGSDDMSPIFEEIAASISFAATAAVVTDPLGEMFNLVKDGSYSGANFTASHGNVTWDDATETFTWNIGNVGEGEVYTLTYKVALECAKEPEAGVKYPTNKTTPLNYKDHNGNSTSKEFPIPKVSVDKGKIEKLGYRVNVDGDPVDSIGNVVSSPAEAEQFYHEMFGENLDLDTTYSVPAGATPDGYQLHVGEDPTEIELTSICMTIPFGYVKTSELPAGKVIAEYVDEDGNEIASSEEFKGHIGEEYTTEQKDIPGYEFVKMHEDSADSTGEFITEEQTVIYVYKQLKGTIKLIKVDEADQMKKLAGAKFVIKDADGKEVGILETGENGEDVSETLPIGDYTLDEIEAPYGYELSTDQVLTITVKANQEVKITVTNKQLKGSIKIIKVDADDNFILLKGATFELRNEAGDTIATETTKENGEYVFTGVAVGKYELVEIEAPEGYRLLNKPIEIEITPDQLTITKTIENSEQGWIIPDTGGNGTLLYYSLGLLLMAVSGSIFFIRRRYV